MLALSLLMSDACKPERARRASFSGCLAPVAALAGVLLATPPATAQEPAPSDLRQFEDREFVFEVQVPVNVIARNGEAVRGLTQEDFEILDEGEAQALTGFRVIDLEQIVPDDRRVIETDYGIPPAARRHFLFLFDLSYSAPTSIAKAQQAAHAFVLEQMHPTDLAAVGIHTVESGPQLLITFTPDRSQLARAIATLGNPRLLQLATEDPLGFLIDTPGPAPELTSSLDVGGVNPGITEMERSMSSYLQVIGREMAKSERNFARGQISRWADTLHQMARILSSVEGRKHLILFSEGFDGRLLFGRQPDFFDEELRRETDLIERGHIAQVDTDQRFGNTQLQTQVHQMLREFNRANTAIHTVDISGLRADSREEDRARVVGRDALFYMANETGGRLHEDANDFGAELEEVLESSTVTYLLSFQPTDPGEAGDHHRLRVRARAPKGAQLSHRMGYYTPRPYGDLHPMEKRLLASDLIAAAAERDDLTVNVLAAPFRAGPNQAYIPVIVEIDGGALLEGHESPRLPVEIYAYITDERTEVRDFFSRVVTLDLTGRHDTFANTGLKYYGSLDLPPGDYLLRVLARNASTGATGVETLALHVPTFEDGEPTLLPPFFHEEPGAWFLVREQPADQYAKSTVYPFTVNGEPYVPSAVPLFAEGGSDESEICLVGYNLGEGDLSLRATVLDADGERMAAGALNLRERTVTGIPGLDKLVAAFDPVDLPAGDYTLRVTVTDPATQAQPFNSIPLRVLN